VFGKGIGPTYQSLQVADEQTLEDLARLVAVADVLEGLGGVLATDVEEDLLTTTIESRGWLVFFFSGAFRDLEDRAMIAERDAETFCIIFFFWLGWGVGGRGP
jgi:hypothetical protein